MIRTQTHRLITLIALTLTLLLVAGSAYGQRRPDTGATQPAPIETQVQQLAEQIAALLARIEAIENAITAPTPQPEPNPVPPILEPEPAPPSPPPGGTIVPAWAATKAVLPNSAAQTAVTVSNEQQLRAALRSGRVIDLGGATITLSSTLNVSNLADVTIRNGRLDWPHGNGNVFEAWGGTKRLWLHESLTVTGSVLPAPNAAGDYGDGLGPNANQHELDRSPTILLAESRGNSQADAAGVVENITVECAGDGVRTFVLARGVQNLTIHVRALSPIREYVAFVEHGWHGRPSRNVYAHGLAVPCSRWQSASIRCHGVHGAALVDSDVAMLHGGQVGRLGMKIRSVSEPTKAAFSFNGGSNVFVAGNVFHDGGGIDGVAGQIVFTGNRWIRMDPGGRPANFIGCSPSVFTSNTLGNQVITP